MSLHSHGEIFMSEFVGVHLQLYIFVLQIDQAWGWKDYPHRAHNIAAVLSIRVVITHNQMFSPQES